MPTLDVSNLTKNALPSGAQIQTKRTASQNFATVATAVSVVWPVPFPDTNYTVTATMVDENNTGFLTLGNTSLSGGGSAIAQKFTTGITVFVNNVDSNPVTHPGHIEAIAIHD